MNISREQPNSLSIIFEQRKDSFLDSLQHILKAIGSDLFIKQMFDSKSSEVYVPDRICEIVEQNLNGDREKYVKTLEQRLRAFEACFGKERLKKFEEIGNNILDHSEKMKRMKNFNANDSDNQKYVQMISEEFKKFNHDSNPLSDLQFSKKDIKKLKDKVHSLNQLIASNNNFFIDLQNQLLKTFKQISKEAKAVVIDSIAQNDKKIEQIKAENKEKTNFISEIERKFSDSENQANFLRQQIDSKDEIIKMLKESQNKSNEQFQQQITQKDKEISDLQLSISQISNNNESHSNENSNLRNTINEKDQELHLYQDQIQEMRETFSKLKESMPEKKQIIEKVQKLQEKNRQMKLIIDDQANKIEYLYRKKKQLAQKVELLNQSLNEKNELIQKMRGNMTDSLQNESEKSMTISQLKDKIREYDSAIKTLTKKVKLKHAQCSSLTKENKDYRNEIVEIKEELKKTKDELESSFESIQNLKEESKSKDSIIEEFKSSLRKSSSTSRDLNSATMKINEQSLIIRSNEETNAQLMKEISKQEEKIKEITEKFIDCDKKLKKQIQTNFAQSKQNETLSALNSKQEKELEETHLNIIKLQSRLLQYESDTQNHSDSIKNLTNDNNREVTERKLIESFISKERERYHDEVNNLQKKISEFIVEKTDLSHKLDQVVFENSTLKQLLESREKELNFEKQKNLEDIKKMREMTSKVLKENERLKRLNNMNSKSNEYSINESTIDDNNISMDFKNNFSINANRSKDELFNESGFENQNNSNDFNNLNKFDYANENDFNDSSNKDDTIGQLKQIRRLLECENDSNAINKLAQIKGENNELKQVHEKLRQLCGTDDVLSTVQQMKKQNSFYQEQSKNLEKLLPDQNISSSSLSNSNSNSGIVNKVIDMKDKMKTLEKTKSLLNCNDVNEIPIAIQQLSNDNKKLRNNLESIKKAVPLNNSSDEDLVSTITDAFKIKSQLLNSPSSSPSIKRNSKEASTKIEKIKDESSNFQMIKKSLSKSGIINNDDVSRKVIEMQNNEQKLQEILHSDDIVSSVQSMMKENEMFKNNEKNLSNMLNQSSSSFDDNKSTNEKIAELIHQNSEMKKTQTSIQNLLPASTQANIRSTSSLSGRKHQDQFSLNLRNYQEKVTNLVDENKQLKHEKEIVEQLLRPFQKDEFKQNDEVQSPQTIREILQENKKLKQIQKSACSMIGSNEEDFESKVKELVETKKKIESILPYQDEETDLQTRVTNLMNENESLKDSMESISRIIPKKNRHRNHSAFSSPTNKFNSESDFENNSYSFTEFNNSSNNNESIEDVLRNYVEQNETLNKKIRNIKSMIPGHFTDLEEGIENVLKENRKLKQDQIKARHAIPSFLATKIRRKSELTENIEFEEEEEDLENSSSHYININNNNDVNSVNKNDENYVTDFPHLIEELAKDYELLEQEKDEVSGILPGNRTDPIIDRLNKLINEKNSLEDNENEVKEILADFAFDDDDDVISIVKNLANKVRQIGKIIPFRSPRQFASSCPTSPQGSPIHKFSFHSDSSPIPIPKKNFDFVSSVKQLVNDNSRLEEIQREANELISENFNQNPNQSLIEKINSLLTSNAIFKGQQERISKLIFGENSESNPISIEGKINELLTENQELKQTESELNKLIPSDKYKKGTIQENVRDILLENEQNDAIKENVKKMLNEAMPPNSPLANDLSNNGSYNDDFYEDNEYNNSGVSKRSQKSDSCFSPTGKLESRIENLIQKKNKIENDIKQIEEILAHDENDNNKSIQERITNLVNENQSLKEEKDQLNSLFNPQYSSNNSDHSKSENKSILNDVQKVLSTLDELKNILPEGQTNLPEAFHAIVAEKEALLKQKSELENLMTSSDSTVPSDLSTKLQKVLEENADLRKRLKRVTALFPSILPNSFDDIIMQIRLLIENNSEMKNLRNDIAALLRMDNKRKETSRNLMLDKLDKMQKDNMLQQIKNLVDQCQLLKSDKETLDKVKKIFIEDRKDNEQTAETDESDDDQLSEVSVIDEVQRLLRSKNEFQLLSQFLFDLFHCNSIIECRQKIEDSQKNTSCLTELVQRLFDAIAAPSQSSPIRLAFPIFEKRKLSLFKMIDSFKKRLLESQQTVEKVIEKARKFGFNGGPLELPSAVQFLEEMAAIAERQKLDENFQKEIEELRELSNKQQKMAEQKSEKFKKKIQEKVAFANEMQEKLNQKETLFIEEVEAERKKARQYGILAEKQKRIITELIRVISGKGADIEFLKSNLNVSDAVALQYAEAIHDTIVKIQNDGRLFL